MNFFVKRAAGSDPARGNSSPEIAQRQEFNRLILPHLESAYNFARYLTRDAVLAEDAVQDAMLRAFRALEQHRGSSARAWLFTIVRNCCRTAQAGSGGSMSLVTNESGLNSETAAQIANHPDPRPTPEEEMQSRDMVSRVREAVEAIPEPFREAVVLRELEELSYAEISEVTGVPIGTVMSRLARGRAILARALLPSSVAAEEPSWSVK